MQKPFIIAVVGPTAIGKSRYAINLAKQVNGEIISADSRQVYKGLDVGSGKVTKRQLRGIPHYMLDVVSPKTVFSTHRFKKLATPILKNILARGKMPLVVGGTGYYFDTLLGNVALPNVPPNKTLRKKIGKMSADALFKKLEKLDPVRAQTIDKHNPVRLIRAIEIATALGAVPAKKKEPVPYKILWVGLTAQRDVLRKKIIVRTRAQLAKGMIQEVKKLRDEGVSWKRLHALGLEQRLCAEYLQGKMNKEELEEKLITHVYRYAIRQLRWFKRNKEVNWIEMGE